MFACMHEIGLKSLQEYSADDRQTTFSDAGFCGVLRVNKSSGDTLELPYQTEVSLMTSHKIFKSKY